MTVDGWPVEIVVELELERRLAEEAIAGLRMVDESWRGINARTGYPASPRVLAAQALERDLSQSLDAAGIDALVVVNLERPGLVALAAMCHAMTQLLDTDPSAGLDSGITQAGMTEVMDVVAHANSVAVQLIGMECN